MHSALFAYDIVLLIALAGAVAGFFIAFLQRHEMLLVWVAAFFLAIIVDHVVLFSGEFLGTTTDSPVVAMVNLLYALSGALILLCERMVARGVLDWDLAPWEWAVICLNAAWFVLDAVLDVTLPAMSAISVLRLCYTLYVISWSIVLLVRRRGQMDQGHYWFLLAFCSVTLATFSAGHLIDFSLGSSISPTSGRNMFSEVLTVEYLVFAFLYLSRLLVKSDDPEMARADALDRFARTHDLTGREREILALIVEGKSNQEISSELWLSLGTVKTHAHNIYRKSGVTKRGELLGAFSDFERSM